MRKRDYIVVIEAEGFALVEGVERVFIPWSSVREIVAYKLDLITTDEVRLRLDLDCSPFSVSVSEDMQGFDSFKSATEKYFEFPEGWWSHVVQPAFIENARVLFTRS